MSNLIVKAKHEVFLATNFWKHSEGSRLIDNAIRELSKRALSESRKVVVKVMYDRGDVKQVITPHQSVPAKIFADPKGAIKLPHPDDIPNVDLEVVNYHRPPLGTFHAKFMVVDRKIAITQSNNIQDNDNLEMMAQWEGAIVDSLYDYSLITWNNAMKPPLPLLSRPAADAPPPTFSGEAHKAMFDDSNRLRSQYGFTTAMPEGDASLKDLAAHAANRQDLPLHTSQDPHYDDDISHEVLRAAAGFIAHDGEPLIASVNKVLNVPAQDTSATINDIKPSEMMTPLIPLAHHEPFPIAMVCREPYGPPSTASLHTPQNAAWIAALRNATSSVFIQTPDLNAEALLPEILRACRRGVQVVYYYCLGYNDIGENLPLQGGHNEAVANKLLRELEPEHRSNLNIYCYVAKDQNIPIHNKFKKRSCHIKLLIADEHLAIQGSGNQDTQSWYHSQEVNVMIDSPLVCDQWLAGIRQNQNTHVFGKVEKEGADAGCWKHPETGKQADGAIGVDAGRFAWAKGIEGAIARMRGTGGF